MISLKASKRTNKDVQQIETIPAVLYGPGIENLNISVNFKEFEKVHKVAGETLIDLDVDGVSYSVLIYDIQFDPMTIEPMHVDFYQPNLKNEVETQVPLELVGVAPAVGIGGTIIANLHELTVKALPKDLPAKIEVDVTVLTDFGNHILVKDLKLPKGVKAISHEDEVIVQIVAPTNVDAELAEPVAEVKEAEVTAEKEEEKKEKE